MNWIKQNKKLAVILGIMAAGTIGLGVWLFMAWSEYGKAREEWEQKSAGVASLQKSKDYPSKENVAAAQAKLDEFRTKFATLRTALLDDKLQRPVKPIKPTEFQERLKTLAKEAKTKADAVLAKDKKLAVEFALGFDDYVKDVPQNDEVAAELNVHLDVMKRLSDILLDAGVSSIEVFERTRVAGEKKGQPAPAAPVAQPKPAPGKGKGPAPVPVVAEPVLDRFPIKLQFTCDQVPLQKVLNALGDPAQTPDFLAVRLFHVENVRQDAPSMDEVKNAINSAANSAEAPKPTLSPNDKDKDKKKTIATVAPAKEDAIDVLGGELLRVAMEVDYIRVRPSKESASK